MAESTLSAKLKQQTTSNPRRAARDAAGAVQVKSPGPRPKPPAATQPAQVAGAAVERYYLLVALALVAVAAVWLMTRGGSLIVELPERNDSEAT